MIQLTFVNFRLRFSNYHQFTCNLFFLLSLLILQGCFIYGEKDKLSLSSIPYIEYNSSGEVGTWDPVSGNSQVDDGAGAWASGISNFTYDGGVNNSPWVDGASVNFGSGSSGSAGIVTIGGTIYLKDLNFSTPFAGNYILSSGAIYLMGSTITVNGGTPTISSVVEGNGVLTKLGSGTLILSQANTYNNGTILGAGRINVANDAAFGTGDISVSGNSSIASTSAGARIIGNNIFIHNGVSLSAIGSAANLTLSGVISGQGNFETTSSGTVVISGVNTYSGSTTISTNGTLSLGSNGAIDGTSDVSVLSGGTFDIGSYSPATKTLTLRGAGVSSLGALVANSATWNGDIVLANNSTVGVSGTTTIGGSISGTNSLTKIGAGTLILNGANTYSNVTNISAGEVQFNGANSGSGAKSVNGGTLSGIGVIVGAVTVANTAGSVIRGGAGSGSSGILAINGSLTFSGSTSALNVTSNGTTGVSRVNASGAVALGGCTVNVLDPISPGTYTILNSLAGMSGTLCSLGTNLSGNSVSFAQVGNALRMTVF